LQKPIHRKTVGGKKNPFRMKTPTRACHQAPGGFSCE
jgi:hypothetical protein